MPGTLLVSEIFYSLQGESTFSGLPCVFVRLSGCNLRCSYCDTRYALDTGKPYSVEEIRDRVLSYPARLVEITGGEPMLQDAVMDLFPLLHAANCRILLETNGSVYLGDVPDHVVKIVDVKCPGSGFGDSFMKWNLRCLQPHDELKFVLTNHDDYRFALRFIEDNSLNDRILLFSPVQSVLPPETLATWMLADSVKARLQLQLHRILNIK
jgi:7-carboxy-7-deazaguanine synthase